MKTDSSGRPVDFIVAGKSATTTFSAAEHFRNYNKPVTVTAP